MTAVWRIPINNWQIIGDSVVLALTLCLSTKATSLIWAHNFLTDKLALLEHVEGGYCNVYNCAKDKKNDLCIFAIKNILCKYVQWNHRITPTPVIEAKISLSYNDYGLILIKQHNIDIKMLGRVIINGHTGNSGVPRGLNMGLQCMWSSLGCMFLWYVHKKISENW